MSGRELADAALVVLLVGWLLWLVGVVATLLLG